MSPKRRALHKQSSSDFFAFFFRILSIISRELQSIFKNI